MCIFQYKQIDCQIDLLGTKESRNLKNWDRGYLAYNNFVDKTAQFFDPFFEPIIMPIPKTRHKMLIWSYQFLKRWPIVNKTFLTHHITYIEILV